jgi:hypothetical protein
MSSPGATCRRRKEDLWMSTGDYALLSRPPQLRLTSPTRSAIHLARHIAGLCSRQLYVDKRDLCRLSGAPHRYLLTKLPDVLGGLPPAHLQSCPEWPGSHALTRMPQLISCLANPFVKLAIAAFVMA